MILKIVAAALIVALIALLAVGIILNRHPRKIGVKNGKLGPCPFRPNCVSSQSEDPLHKIAPFPIPENYMGSSIDLIADIIKTFPKTTIVTKEKNYLHAEFRSKIFSFTDDVEFLIDPEEKVIHVRSASRVGYGDFGVNRSRIENIRRSYTILFTNL